MPDTPESAYQTLQIALGSHLATRGARGTGVHARRHPPAGAHALRSCAAGPRCIAPL